MKEFFCFAVIVAVVMTVLMFHKPPSTIANQDQVPQNKPRFHWWKDAEDGDGTLSVAGTLNGRVGRFTIDDGVPYKPKPGSLDDIPGLQVSYTEDVYFGQWNYDFGTFAAYRRGQGGHTTDPFQVGVRFSPARLLYGTVAPDIVISRDCIGGGVSLYAPKKYAGQFSHLGLGAWYTYPLAGTARAGSPAWNFGLSFSTQPR